MIDPSDLTVIGDLREPKLLSILKIADLAPGECFSVTGTPSLYHLLVLDKERSLVICQGGSKPLLREPRVLRFEGSGQGRDIMHPGAVRHHFQMIMRFPDNVRTTFTSSSVAPNGIRRLNALPLALAPSFETVRELYRSEEVLRDPEYREALEHLLKLVPFSHQESVSRAIDSFSPIGRVLLLAVLQSAHEDACLNRLLDFFEHQTVLHWSRCPAATRGEPLTERDVRYLRELCMYSKFPIPDQLRRAA